MAGVRFDQMSKVYGMVAAVKDLTLEIADGEFLVLVGPSGCGTSTTLRLLAGLESISSGRILIGDRLVNNVPAKDRDIAMAFQSYALYPQMSVFDNMAFGLKLRGALNPEIQERVEKAAGVLGIGELLTRKPGQLSGGQRQRVALGRAMVRNPAVFLLDEPLSNLDAKLRVQTRIEIKKLHQRLGTTFVYVTHDQVEAMTMATRVAVLNAGVLQQSSSTSPGSMRSTPRPAWQSPRRHSTCRPGTGRGQHEGWDTMSDGQRALPHCCGHGLAEVTPNRSGRYARRPRWKQWTNDATAGRRSST